MIKNKDTFNPVGEIEVWKMYEDGREPELHFSDHNVITSGMGVALASLYSGSGSQTISDYQILSYQLGYSGAITNPYSYGTSSTQLINPLKTSQYVTAGSQLVVEERNILINGVSTAQQQVGFVSIPYSNIQRVTPTSVRYTLVIDKNSCLGLTDTEGLKAELNEVGLLMYNPLNINPTTSVLVAYRPFTPIYKTGSFALVIKWTLTF
jgi:hypothetical protein